MIEYLVGSGEVHGQEVLLFTNNSTFESTYCKGYSTSWKLSRIVLWLYQVIQYGSLLVHVIHMTGTRVKVWGVDGMSRVDLMEGMMTGEDPILSAPLVKGAN